MFDFPTLRKSVLTIVGDHHFLLQEFDSTVRNIISSSDLELLLTNSIPHATIQNSIQSSLQHVANTALKRFEETQNLQFKVIADQLWNPLVAVFTTMKIDASPDVSTKPASTKTRNKHTVSKPMNVPIPASVDRRSVRTRLLMHAEQTPFLFRNQGHDHIHCDSAKCTYCRHLFETVNITQCSGHKKCHVSGYYPHIGTALWAMLKAGHTKRTKCKLQPKAPKDHEIESIRSERVVALQSSDAEEEAMSTSNSPKRRIESIYEGSDDEEDSNDWATSVEAMVRKKRGLRASSAPPL